jgi:hypothetical protein
MSAEYCLTCNHSKNDHFFMQEKSSEQNVNNYCKSCDCKDNKLKPTKIEPITEKDKISVVITVPYVPIWRPIKHFTR